MRRFEYFVKPYFFSSFLTTRCIDMRRFVRDRIISRATQSGKG
jgi:hypothetical protein